MISYNYNFDEFIKSLIGKSYPEMLITAEKEVYAEENLVAGGRRGAPDERKRGCPEYINILKGFLFYLRYNIKPSGISDYEFLKFKLICEDLIKTRNFKQEAIDIFKNKNND